MSESKLIYRCRISDKELSKKVMGKSFSSTYSAAFVSLVLQPIACKYTSNILDIFVTQNNSQLEQGSQAEHTAPSGMNMGAVCIGY